MVNTNELRRNNLIYYGTMIYPVERITGQSISVRLSSQSLRTANPHEFEPVELSPELLEACGFEWETDQKRHLQICIDCESILSFYFNDGVMEQIQLYNNGCADHYSMDPLRHLHELQNLWHSLTGSELSINLEKVKV